MALIKRLVIMPFLMILLLGGCFSDQSDTPIASSSHDDSPPKITTPEPTATRIMPSLNSAETILDLYNKWDGKLICGQQTYSSNDTIYFSGDSVDCAIQLEYTQNLHVTSDHLKKLQAQFISSADPWNDVQFVNLTTSAQDPSMLAFRMEPPEQPLTLLFRTERSDVAYTYHFEKVAPFSFTVTRPFEVDSAIAATGIRHYLKTGQSHLYNISFSEPVRKDLTEQHIDVLLGGLSKEIKWASDRSLLLTLQLKPGDEISDYDEYLFHFNANIAEQKKWPYAISGNSIVRFQPAAMKKYRVVDLSRGKEDRLFSSLISYSALDLSPNGQWILAEELSNRESILVPSYTLLDREGKRLKELKMDTPKWLKDEDSLLYKTRNSIIRYDILTGEEHIVWQDLAEPAILSFKVNPNSGSLMIMAGHYDENSKVSIDLHLYKGMEDANPKRYENLFYVESGMEWDGLHYEVPAYELENGFIYFVNDVPDQNRQHYLMSEENGQILRIDTEVNEGIYPMRNGKLLRVQDGSLKVYDAVTGKETKLPLEVDENKWLRVIPTEENRMLLVVADGHGSTGYLHLLHLQSLALKEISVDSVLLSNHGGKDIIVT